MAEQLAAEDERLSYQKSCLTGRGIVFEVDDTGGYSFPGESVDMGSEALAECTREHLGEAYGASPSVDQLRVMYARALDVRECLESEGHTISEPVSVEAYIDSGGQWSAYDDVNPSSQEAYVKLRRACPEPGLESLP